MKSRTSLLAIPLLVLVPRASAAGDDCNGNGVPDDQDIASGTSDDCNGDGIPDECGVSEILLFLDFDGGNIVPPGVTFSGSGLWHNTSACSPPGECGTGNFKYFGINSNCNYDNGQAVFGQYTIHNVTIPADSFEAKLTYCYAYQGEGCDYAYVEVNGVTLIDYPCGAGSQIPWATRVVDLTPFVGQTVDIVWTFETFDSLWNYFYGWAIDNITIGNLGAVGIDCDGNGIMDECEIADDPSLDLDGSGTLDACECFAQTFCVSSANSTGLFARIDSSGPLSLSGNQFSLTANGLPPNEWGVFFYGQHETEVVFGNGVRCVGGNLVRLDPPIQMDENGLVELVLDFYRPPFLEMVGGDSAYFQLWYRDPPAGGSYFNLTNALKVIFCP